MCKALGSLVMWILDVDAWVQILFSSVVQSGLLEWKGFCGSSLAYMLLKFSRNRFLWELQSDKRSCWTDFSASRLQESQKYHFCLLSLLYLCPGCAGPAFTQLRLHTDFLVLSQKLPINRTWPISNTNPHVFAVKPSPKSQPCLISQCLFDLCCCLAFSCYWEKGLWFPVMAAQQEEMSSWTTKSLFSYMFPWHRKMRGARKSNKFQSVIFLSL